MGLKYLLDSNVLSQPPRPQPNPAVMQQLVRHAGAVATTAIVLHEMLHGTLRLPASRRRRDLEDYLAEMRASVPILPYDEEAAAWHAQERARLYRTTPAFADGQIAAIAAVHDLIVVTANVRHFKPFRIQVENWMR